jgi:hypothetical protein
MIAYGVGVADTLWNMALAVQHRVAWFLKLATTDKDKISAVKDGIEQVSLY